MGVYLLSHINRRHRKIFPKTVKSFMFAIRRRSVLSGKLRNSEMVQQVLWS